MDSIDDTTYRLTMYSLMSGCIGQTLYKVDLNAKYVILGMQSMLS